MVSIKSQITNSQISSLARHIGRLYEAAVLADTLIDYDIRDMHRATLSYRTPILPQLHCTKPMLVHPM